MFYVPTWDEKDKQSKAPLIKKVYAECGLLAY